jgi:cytochrome c biogenesis protein CcmG/thiol:disulfide interchange protein DsbE
VRRLILPGLVTLAAVALLALLAFGVSHQGSDSSIDAAVAAGRFPTAPSAAAALPRLEGSGTLSLRQLRGRVVLLNVFASWCGPCKAEAAVLDRAERKLAGHGGTVLGVTYLDNTDDSRAFVRREHVSYPVVRDVSGDFVRSFGTTGVPESFLIGRDGRILAVRRFQLDQRWITRTLALAAQA